MSGVLALFGLRWALAWFVYAPDGALLAAQSTGGFSNVRACEEFAHAAQKLAEPNDIAWKCAPTQVLPETPAGASPQLKACLRECERNPEHCMACAAPAPAP